MRNRRGLGVLSGLLLCHGCAVDLGEAEFDATGTFANDPVLRWNSVALEAVAADHSGIYGSPENGGPTRASRALAIVHIAIYDATVAIAGSHEPYLPVELDPTITQAAAVDAAVAQAAHDTLVALYPSQQAVLDQELARALSRGSSRGVSEGLLVGEAAATNILSERADDNSNLGDEVLYPNTQWVPGEHQADPTNPDQGLLGPGWGRVETFSGIDVTAKDVRAPPPPEMTDPAYTAAFRDVYDLGGDDITTPTKRTKEQTEIGLFWAYDGTPKLGPPPVLYNQILQTLAKQEKNTVIENARLFALANIAQADAGIACWDSKFYYDLWRPIVAIRLGGLDGNAQTIGNPNWTPMGAPASNRIGNNFTPPFPAYPSGHATFGGATFRVLELFYETDDIAFRLKSDELNGKTTDNTGKHRHTVVRRFDSFTSAMQENARSRIYLGIHWQFDADRGIDQGMAIADYVYSTLLLPNP